MTPEIALTLGILLLAVALLAWERLRVDLVALLVLVTLALTGLVSPDEAISGFSSPAVVTVWAVFILSAGLARTGVANKVGRTILRLGGGGQGRLLLIIMLVAAGLSAFMNNVGVAAMLLPVVTHVARKTGRPASRLLMPLAFGCLLGGTTTLIGTPPNILVSDALGEFGLPEFGLFDFARVGLPFTLVGVLYMVVLGQRLLPERSLESEFERGGSGQPSEYYDLSERFFRLRLPQDSPLAGKSLGESRLGSALKLTVIGIQRNGKTKLAPEPGAVLRAGDQLLVLGRSDWLDELSGEQQITLEAGDGNAEKRLHVSDLISKQISVVEAILPEGSPLLGRSLAASAFRANYRANVLAIWKEDQPVRTDLQRISLDAGDRLLVQASRARLNEMGAAGVLEIPDVDTVETYNLEERLLLLGIPARSSLAGKSLAESKLADAFGLSVLGILRDGKTKLMPPPKERLQANDKLVVEGRVEDVAVLRALCNLEIEASAPPALSELESEEVGLVEVVVSPHSNLDGQTLRQLNFREKFGLSVLAIWRGGRAFRSNLREMPLRYGDSLLVYGNRNRIRLLAGEREFLVLSPEIQPAPRSEKGALATAIMGGVVLVVGLGWMPIVVAAIAGAALMVLSDCINMEEAYHAIQWQAIFLIAGMLPLGIAMQNSGAAQFLATGVISAAEPYGPLALMAGLFLLTMLSAQVMPSPVVAVLMIPIALNTASNMGFSPQSLAMLVALGASTIFMSPVSHPANVLVMGPGGYRFSDFARVGLPLTILMLALVLLVLPIAWPLMP